MIRLYCDWNALVHLRSGFLPELEQLLSVNGHRFHIFYSTAHIGDIYKGYKEVIGITDGIKQDLKFIEKTTSNLCFVPSDKGIIVNKYSPLELFEDRITIEQWAEEFFSDFQYGSEHLSTPLNLLYNSFKHIPLQSLEGHERQFQEIFSGIESNKTFQGLFQSLITLFKDLNTTEKYKDLRIWFQTGIGINRDRMYNNPAPFKQLDKLIKKSSLEENNFEEFQKRLSQIRDNKNQSWFDEISNKYITLDMSGYKEDRIEVSEKKSNTFKNTIEDAFHTAFASQCDIYITNDDRNYHKAKAVYQSFNINTKVFTTSEFYNYITEYLNLESSRSFLENVFDKLKSSQGYITKENSETVIYFFEDYILDYFNKTYWSVDSKEKDSEDNWMLVLTKEKPTNGRFTFIKDVDTLIGKLIHLFGIPKQNKLTLSPKEVKEIQEQLDWDGRRWYIGNLLIKFISINGYFQLYIYPISREPDN